MESGVFGVESGTDNSKEDNLLKSLEKRSNSLAFSGNNKEFNVDKERYK